MATSKKRTKRVSKTVCVAGVSATIAFELDPSKRCGEKIPKGAPWIFAWCELGKGHAGDVHATSNGRAENPRNIHFWPVEVEPSE